MSFDITQYSSIFKKPKRIVSTAWIEHAPFAFFLIEILKPKILVELGVHNGYSFCAFSQAVREYNTQTKCYGLDTFEGEKHAGFYDDSVYQELSLYVNANYKDLAQLMKMKFDKGLEYFTEGSVDLLHIDGLHTYEAVKHDYESWQEKMSDKGVIIFHDTMVRRDDFGVWKLWEEIKDIYPSYEFRFGYGLGILAVGKNIDKDFLNFLELISKSKNLENIFFNLGEKIQKTKNINQKHNYKAQLFYNNGQGYSEKNSLTKKIEEDAFHVKLTFDLTNVNNDITSLRFDPLDSCTIVRLKNVIINQKKLIKNFSSNAIHTDKNSNEYYFDTYDPIIDIKIDGSFNKVNTVTVELEYLKKGISARENVLEVLKDKIKMNNQYVQRLENESKQLEDKLNKKINYLNNSIEDKDIVISKKTKELKKIENEVSSLQDEVSSLQDELTIIYTGKSWQVTRPLRKLKNLLKGKK